MLIARTGAGPWLALAAVLAVPWPALAAPGGGQGRVVAVPAQPVDQAIIVLGKQAGVQILGVKRILHGRMAHGVAGAMSVTQALEEMLAGTGLVARMTAPQTFVIVEAPDIAEKPMPALRRKRPPAPPPRAVRKEPLPALAASIDPVDILVTGSRTITNGNAMPTPVTVVTVADLLAAQPASVVSALGDLPELLGSLGPTTNINTGGLNAINLRGVGVTRALLMVDGRRAGPTLGDNTLNPDVVPQILLKRVDVVTGGVSAIYGSDAVAGVVNFITDTAFTGFKAHVQGGLSTYGDDRKINLGAAWGRGFAQGRGHVEIGLEYRDAPGIKSRADRPFTANTIWSEQGTVPGGGTVGSATNPYGLTRGAVLATASFGGLITSGPLAGLQFGPGGDLTAFAHGRPTGTPGVEVGGDGAYFTGGSLSAGQRVYSGFGRADFDVTPAIHAFGSLSVTHFRQSYTGQNLLLGNMMVGYDNPYLATLAPAYQAIIAQQAPGDSFRMGKMFTDIPDFAYQITENYYQATAGLEGKAGGWDWSASYVHSDSRMTTTNTTNINAGRLFAALDTVSDGHGGAVCHAALVNPAYAGCVPLDPLGPNAASQAAIAWIEQPTHTSLLMRMDDISATAKREVAQLPAGPVKAAFNTEWRRLAYRAFTDAPGDQPVDCTGIRFNCSATTQAWLGGASLGGASSTRSPVSQKVAEGAMEVDLPVLADRRWARALSFNAALRYTHYDTSGDALTWKLSGDWQVDDDLRLRVTRSRDIRAPSLLDLYAPMAYTRKSFIDTHTATAGFVTFITQGNPALTPERAATWTAGFVYKPHRLPGLSLSVDYYHIDIGNAITEIDGYQPSVSALCDASGGSAQICSLIVRPLPYANTSAANFPTTLLAATLNVAHAKAYGVDVEANYATRLLAGPLRLRLLANWQPHVIFDNGPGGVVDVGGTADGAPGVPVLPSVKLIASAVWQATPGLELRLIERWRNAVRQNGNAALSFIDGKVPAVGYTDLSLDYTLRSGVTAFLNIRNLFNTWPPAFASSGGSSQMNYLGGFAQGDDIEGRTITLGVTMRLP